MKLELNFSAQNPAQFWVRETRTQLGNINRMTLFAVSLRQISATHPFNWNYSDNLSMQLNIYNTDAPTSFHKLQNFI